MAQLNAGLVGCGPRQRAHVAALRQIPEVRLAACADLDARRLQEFGEAQGIPSEHRYRSAAEMAAAVQLDIANVVTPAAVRLGPVAELAAARVPLIVVEKPMAVDLEEADELLRLCAAAGSRLIVNHQYRFLPFALRLKEAVDSGALGTIEYLRATCPNKLHGQGTHMIDLANFLHGDVALQWVMGAVGGVETFDGKLPGPDRDAAVFAYEDDVRLYLECGRQVPRTDPGAKQHLYIEVVGSRGRAWGGIDSGCRIVTAGGGVTEERQRWADGDRLAEPALYREAIAALTGDRATAHRSRGELGRRTLEAMVGVLQSALEHRLITFPLSVAPGYMATVRRQLVGGAESPPATAV